MEIKWRWVDVLWFCEFPVTKCESSWVYFRYLVTKPSAFIKISIPHPLSPTNSLSAHSKAFNENPQISLEIKIFTIDD